MAEETSLWFNKSSTISFVTQPFDIFIDLPAFNFSWNESILFLQSFFMRSQNDNKIISTSPPIPIRLMTTFLVPLYMKSARLRLGLLSNQNLSSLDNPTSSNATQILNDLTLLRASSIELPEIEQNVFSCLKKFVDQRIVPSAQVVSAILELIERNKSENMMVARGGDGKGPSGKTRREDFLLTQIAQSLCAIARRLHLDWIKAAA
jgi:hypothetical protein